jgi:hypothetical protein
MYEQDNAGNINSRMRVSIFLGEYHPKWQDSCAIVGKAIVRHTIDQIVESIVDLEEHLYA